MTDTYDLIVIGGGSGGLACAQRAAEYGARAVVIESHRLGGTCVNVGCVPKKIMWNAAQIAHAVHDAADYGFSASLEGLDWPTLKRKRDEYVLRLNGIYERNLASRKVELIRGRASLAGPTAVEVGGRTVRGSALVIATGGQPIGRRFQEPSSASHRTDSSSCHPSRGASRSSAAAISPRN